MGTNQKNMYTSANDQKICVWVDNIRWSKNQFVLSELRLMASHTPDSWTAFVATDIFHCLDAVWKIADIAKATLSSDVDANMHVVRALC